MIHPWRTLALATALASAALAARPADRAVDRVWILSPEWVLLINDDMDETDDRIYRAHRAEFDGWLGEQEKLERGETPNWSAVKRRQTLWQESYARLSDEHLWMRDPSSFVVRWPDDPARPPVGARASVSWVERLGDRTGPAASPVRGCGAFEIAHCAYVRLPAALTNGTRCEVRQKDGRLAALTFDDARQIVPVVKVNQVGYLPASPHKYAYLGGWIPTAGPLDYRAFRTFEVCREGNGQAVFRGPVTLRALDRIWTGRQSGSYSGEEISEMDFGGLTNSGTYYVRVPGLGRSWPFEISPRAYGPAFYVAARGFYHQRCGCALQAPFTAWTRGVCHPGPVGQARLPGGGGPIWRERSGVSLKDLRNLDFEIIEATGSTSQLFQVWGGWHDAADYDRRESHHFAIWDLLGLYDVNPAAFTDGQLNLPESSNGVPDLLDEAIYGLQVWRRAQRPDGAVCGRIETTHHPNHRGMPDQDSSVFYKGLETRESTMYYAASAATLARLLGRFDPAAARSWQESAARAYRWATATNTGPLKAEVELSLKPAGSVTPKAYHLTWEESDTAWYFPGLLAALELNALTSDTNYAAELMSRFAPHALRFFDAYPHRLFQAWPLYRLAAVPAGTVPAAQREAAKALLVVQADAALADIERTPYRHPWTPLQSRRWGGALAATRGRYLVMAWKLTGETKYRDAALLCADFQLGCNPLGLVQTTGIGSAYLCAVQDAETRSDPWQDPVPGLTPYGPISVPPSLVEQVYSLKPSAKTGSDSAPVWVLPPPFNSPQPPIPLWRQYAPSETHDPLNNEFTVNETLGPVTLLFGALLGPDWRPPEDLRRRMPTPRESLNGYFWVP